MLFVIKPKTMAVNGTPRIAPPSLWTRPKVQEFIHHLKSDPTSVLVVGRGETMTVRVPTHEGGKCRTTVLHQPNFNVLKLSIKQETSK